MINFTEAFKEACLSLIKETIGEENFDKGIGVYQITYDRERYSYLVFKYHDNFINHDYVKL